MNVMGKNLNPGGREVKTCAYPWIPDCGDGTYRNPVLYADYSDPDVLRHGEDFWMTASSFNCTPGLPILHSHDLVNWTLVNHALRNVPGECYDQVQPGCGVWAPSLRFNAGKFWMFFATPDEGIYVTTATDPRGQWSEPRLLQAGKGLIDPCPLWDDDGTAYLAHAYAHSRCGIKHKLRVVPMSPDATELLGEGQIVFHEPERHHTIEGPKFLKRDGWYYILAPAGGVESGWQVALRARNVFGPYEDRIVLHQGETDVNGPHQGALVDTPGGEWWFLHFQDAGVYGRVVHLQPVEWREGWPLMGALDGGMTAGEPVRQHPKPNLLSPRVATPATSDEFSSSKLGRQWQWHANHRDDWYSLSARSGWLRLYSQFAPQDDLARVPNLLLQKFSARSFSVEAAVEFAPRQAGEEAGLAVVGASCATLALQRTEQGIRLVLRVDGVEQFACENVSSAVTLLVAVAEGGLCQWAFSEQGRRVTVPHAFQARKGKWIGAKFGLYSLKWTEGEGGFLDVNHVRLF